jgi:hypothetical protein
MSLGRRRRRCLTPPRGVVCLTGRRGGRSNTYRLSPYATTWSVRGRGGAIELSSTFTAEQGAVTERSYIARVAVR